MNVEPDKKPENATRLFWQSQGQQWPQGHSRLERESGVTVTGTCAPIRW